MVARTDRGAKQRGVRVVAWILAVVALDLSVSGWLTWFGFALAIPTMIFSRFFRVRGAFTTAAAAACVTAAWMFLGFFVFPPGRSLMVQVGEGVRITMTARAYKGAVTHSFTDRPLPIPALSSICWSA